MSQYRFSGQTKAERADINKISVQEEVALGAMASDASIATAADLAEAMTLAQDFLPRCDRFVKPINNRVAGQWLGYLRSRGLIERVRFNDRVHLAEWKITDYGRRFVFGPAQ